jgi:hypothetical protein
MMRGVATRPSTWPSRCRSLRDDCCRQRRPDCACTQDNLWHGSVNAADFYRDVSGGVFSLHEASSRIMDLPTTLSTFTAVCDTALYASEVQRLVGADFDSYTFKYVHTTERALQCARVDDAAVPFLRLFVQNDPLARRSWRRCLQRLVRPGHRRLRRSAVQLLPSIFVCQHLDS